MIDFERIRVLALKYLKTIGIVIGILSLLIFIYDYGFDQTLNTQRVIVKFFHVALWFFTIESALRFILRIKTVYKKIKITNSIIFILSLGFIAISTKIINTDHHLTYFGFLLEHPIYVQVLTVIHVLKTFATINLAFSKASLNPAQLFILSFILFIVSGTMLLQLPNATYSGINFLDAFFTSTSAVCVTGLIVVDTAADFTYIGQLIILGLIQVGGLGIMTFTVFFTNFFKGSSSFASQVMMKDITNSEKLAEAAGTIRKIVSVTLLFEAAGAILIYLNLDDKVFSTETRKVFFSIFHSISSFCNAGFSTLSNGMYDFRFRFDYGLLTTMSGLIVLGGLGFPILFALQRTFSQMVKAFIRKVTYKEKYRHLHRHTDTNTKIVLLTSVALLFFGTITFLIFEWNNVLSEHSTVFGKMVTSFFASVSPRTAGFNTVNLSSMRFPTVMIIFLLMWIGASPGSTGGGIKTTTFAVVTLNILNLAKGRSRIEIFNRQISAVSIRRAFATISLSLIMIGIGIFMISIFDEKMKLIDIGFECFSAYSTVGLSLGITSSLSSASKIVLIVLMFTGRVSTLTLLFALLNDTKNKNYKYPEENILIN